MQIEQPRIERKYQIFISSTFKDLPDHRRHVLNAIVDRGHMPVALERFSSHAEPVPDVIKRAIEQCQIYVLIVGSRYGSTLEEKDDGGKVTIKSYTQLEYEHAAGAGLKILTFVMRDEDVQNLRAELHRSTDPVDQKEIHHELPFQQFRATAKNPDKHFCCVFRNDEKDFKSEVLKSLFEAEQDHGLRGWVREPKDDSQRDAFSSISRNQYIVDIVGALSALETLDSRVVKSPDEKAAAARCFADFYLPSINDRHISLFLESGSTLTYVADELGKGLTSSRALDKDGVPHVGVSTNNVLAYLILWLKHLIPCAPFPWGTPEKTYGAALGPLSIDITVDRTPEYPPGSLQNGESTEIRKLNEAARGVLRAGNKTLLLGATSGLQLTNKFKLKNHARLTDGIKKCRGPHVGSYKNKLFKRFMYETKHPLMLFLTADKIDSEIEVGKCHFVLDDQDKWEHFIREHPLAFCVGCVRKDRVSFVQLFEQFGFESVFRRDELFSTAFIARNKKFQEVFEKPNEICH
jgi:hypothetical protein